MEIMTIQPPLVVAVEDVVEVDQLDVGVEDVVVGRRSKALEGSSREREVMEERSGMCQGSLSRAAPSYSYEYGSRFYYFLQIGDGWSHQNG